MDYSLAALKLLCVQLRSARQTPSQSAMTLAGVLFQRAWLQGILVSTASHGSDGDGCFLLDDGTGIIELSLSGEFQNHRWDIGMYVMVVGGFVFRTGKISLIKVHKMVDLSPFPDREAVWHLEVIEAFKLFYQPPFEE